MAEKGKNSSLLTGLIVLTGAVIGASIAFHLLDHKRRIDGDLVLENVKQLFKLDGPIEGSWIELEPVELEDEKGLKELYYGGVSCIEDGTLVQYEFTADAWTGKVLQLRKL